MENTERTPLYRVENGVAWLTMNRPETLNSFTQDFLLEINEAICQADRDPAVRVLVVTGEGRGFTSGGNLSELAEMNRDRLRAVYDVDSTADMVRLLYNVKKPVIAAVNGPAFGAGIAMAMACDILIASEKAQFGFSFTGLGFCPDSGSTWFLTQRVGYNKACEILFSAQTLKADELQALGLVNRVVPAEELLPTTAKLAGRLAAGPAQRPGKSSTRSTPVNKLLMACSFPTPYSPQSASCTPAFRILAFGSYRYCITPPASSGAPTGPL